MKLISLNVWGGKIYEPLLEFIGREAAATDVFCFQEVIFDGQAGVGPEGSRANLYTELQVKLPAFNGYAVRAEKGADFAGTILDGEENIGQAIFVRKTRPVLETGHFTVFSPGELEVSLIGPTGLFQWIRLGGAERDRIIGHIHGLWFPDGKKDRPERLRQSEVLLDFYRGREGDKILCGDFNLNPQTESVALLERDFRNLIKQNGIASTRNGHYPNAAKYNDFISDYAFVSPDLHLSKFEVLPDAVSDHLPLVLEFE